MRRSREPFSIGDRSLAQVETFEVAADDRNATSSVAERPARSTERPYAIVAV